MASVEWLESYLQNKWKGGYVIVSHDREFLDKTCKKTLEIQPALPSTLYHCSYSDYVIEREKVEKRSWKNMKDKKNILESKNSL